MELLQGQKVKYNFPNPNSPNKKYFIGTIDSVAESYITIKNESNTLLRVSNKNLYLLEYYFQAKTQAVPDSENYFG